MTEKKGLRLTEVSSPWGLFPHQYLLVLKEDTEEPKSKQNFQMTLMRKQLELRVFSVETPEEQWCQK